MFFDRWGGPHHDGPTSDSVLRLLRSVQAEIEADRRTHELDTRAMSVRVDRLQAKVDSLEGELRQQKIEHEAQMKTIAEESTEAVELLKGMQPPSSKEQAATAQPRQLPPPPRPPAQPDQALEDFYRARPHHRGRSRSPDRRPTLLPRRRR